MWPMICSIQLLICLISISRKDPKSSLYSKHIALTQIYVKFLVLGHVSACCIKSSWYFMEHHGSTMMTLYQLNPGEQEVARILNDGIALEVEERSLWRSQKPAILVEFSGVTGLGNTGISRSKMNILLHLTSCHRKISTVFCQPLEFGGSTCWQDRIRLWSIYWIS